MSCRLCRLAHNQQTTDTLPQNCLPAQTAVDSRALLRETLSVKSSRKGTLGFLGSLTMPSDRNPSRYLAKTSPRYFVVPSSIKSVDPAIHHDSISLLQKVHPTG
jgi:hypothetical protein